MATKLEPIRGTTTIPVDTALAYAHSRGAQGQVDDYVRALWPFAKAFGLNPLVLFAQWGEETEWGVSARWTQNGDPAGIGAFSDSTPSAVNGLTGARSAAVHVVEMACKVFRQQYTAVAGEDIQAFDPHLPRVHSFVQRADWPDVVTINDLRHPLAGGDFVWAEDQQYGDNIAAALNAIVAFAATQQPTGGTGNVVNLTFGNVTHPPFQDRLVTDEQSGAWDDLGQRQALGVCRHSMIGTLEGTDGWFRRGIGVSDGLTDYGIGGSADGALDGVIFRWNDPLGGAHPGVSANRAGWANGGSDGLEGDGPMFVRTLGIGAINRDLVSIERSDGGHTNTPMSQKQFEREAALVAYWFDRAKVPYTSYPLNPAVGIVTDMLHKEFATKDCPFPPVYDRIDELQNRTRAILRAAQEQSPATESVPPVKPPKVPVVWPNKWNTRQLAARFGTVNRITTDGKSSPQTFSEFGPASNAWVARGAKAGMKSVSQLPKPTNWIVLPVNKASGLQPEVIVFDTPGRGNWVLYRPGKEIAWMFVE